MNGEILKGGPVFIMLMGLPGAGKSTFRELFLGKCVHLSTDDLIQDYAEFSGKTYDDVFEDQIKPATSVMNETFRTALRDRESIIWDQTNLGEKKRKRVLSQVPDQYHKLIVVVTCDEQERQERLSSRDDKTIPVHVDRQMRDSLVLPTMDEGWDEMIYYRSDA